MSTSFRTLLRSAGRARRQGRRRTKSRRSRHEDRCGVQGPDAYNPLARGGRGCARAGARLALCRAARARRIADEMRDMRDLHLSPAYGSTGGNGDLDACRFASGRERAGRAIPGFAGFLSQHPGGGAPVGYRSPNIIFGIQRASGSRGEANSGTKAAYVWGQGHAARRSITSARFWRQPRARQRAGGHACRLSQNSGEPVAEVPKAITLTGQCRALTRCPPPAPICAKEPNLLQR